MAAALRGGPSKAGADASAGGRRMKSSQAIAASLSLGLLLAIAGIGWVPAQPAKDAEWARVTEEDRAIKVETDKLEAVIPKKDPKQWMTGIEKGSFLDKATGFREAGDGLMVIDWLMEEGSAEAGGATEQRRRARA